MKRYWNEDERAMLDLMTQQGYGVPAIAKALNCDVMRIYNQTKGGKLLALRQQTGARVRSLFEVAAFFGVNKNSPYYWIEAGWLAARRNKAYAVRLGRDARRPRHLITDAALMAFVENRLTWVAWEPYRMIDPEWRDYAAALRASASGYWMTTKDIAARFGYGAKTVPEWVRRGVMRDVEVVKYGSNLFFWSADIVQWVPPLDRRAA